MKSRLEARNHITPLQNAKLLKKFISPYREAPAFRNIQDSETQALAILAEVIKTPIIVRALHELLIKKTGTGI